MTDPAKMPPMTQPVIIGPNTPNTPPVAPQAQTPAPPVVPKTDTVELSAFSFVAGAAMAVAQGAANAVPPTPTVDINKLNQPIKPPEVKTTSVETPTSTIYTTTYGGIVVTGTLSKTDNSYTSSISWPAGTTVTKDPNTGKVLINLPGGKQVVYHPSDGALTTTDNEIIAIGIAPSITTPDGKIYDLTNGAHTNK